MLIQMLPEQIANNWDFLKTAVIADSGVEVVSQQDRTNNILEGLLAGELQLWLEATNVTGKIEIRGVAVTQILENPIANNKNLLIYSAYGFHAMMTKKEWARILLTLAKYARKQGCAQVIAYTSNEQMIKMAEQLHGDVSQRLVVFNLGGGS